MPPAAKADLASRCTTSAAARSLSRDDYGVRVETAKTRGVAHQHQPFHWFARVLRHHQGGGFDVIIGNPPYVEYSKVRRPRTRCAGFDTVGCGESLRTSSWKRASSCSAKAEAWA